MKRTTIASFLTVLMIILAMGVAYAQSGQTDQGQSNNESPWWCPWCGRYMGEGYGPGGYGGNEGYGPWWHHGWRHRGYMMGPGGMMGRGYMMGPGYNGEYGPWRGYGATESEKPISKDEAKKLLQRYVKSTQNPNLKLGKVTEEKNAYMGEITTKDGSPVDKILVNKKTGWMKIAR